MQKTRKDSKYQDVALALIDEPDGRIRIEPNDEEIEELADNIREIGQLQPIILARKGERFEIVAGERRFIAVSKLGLKKIKAEVREMNAEEIALARASENLKRRDLSPIEEGATYADLVQRFNKSMKEVAIKFGKAPTTIKERIDLLNIDADLQKAIHERKITIKVGVILNQIDDKRELLKCLEYAIENGCTAPVAELWVKDYRSTLIPYDPMGDIGSPPGEMLPTTKIYQACEICEEPVEIQNMRMVRTCPGCFKIILNTIKEGG